jgi:uncharacterized membrane-anchored protein
VLAYALVHLTLWQFFFPTALSVDRTEEQLLAIGGLFALLNAVVLLAAHRSWLQSAVLRVIAFIGLHVTLLAMTAGFQNQAYEVLTNAASLAAIAASFYFYYRIRLNKTMLTLTALAASAYAVIRYFVLLGEYHSTGFYVLGLLFVAILLTANIFFFRFMSGIRKTSVDGDGEVNADNRTDSSSISTTSSNMSTTKRDIDSRELPELHEREHSRGALEALKKEKQEHENLGNGGKGNSSPKSAAAHEGGELTGKIVSTIVTVIGVLIGSASIIGLAFALDGPLASEYLLYIIALALLLAAILLPKLNTAIRYTVLTVGFAVGLVSIAWIDSLPLSLLLMAASVFGWLWLNGRAQHLFIYSLLNINAAILLFQLFDSLPRAGSYIVLILAALNTLVYAAQRLLKESDKRRHLREAGLFYMLVFLLWLTFMDDIFAHSAVWFSIINFVVVTALAFVFIKRNQGWEASVSLAFWFIYIGVKYYDLLWTLMHKSITLALLGLLFLGITYVFAYRTRGAALSGQQAEQWEQGEQRVQGEQAKQWGQDEQAEQRELGGQRVQGGQAEQREQSKQQEQGGQAESYKPWGRASVVWLLLIIGLQLGYLAWFTASSESLLAHGKQIKLQIEPLDPRSMLQGDYVRLNYTISTPPDAVRAELERQPGMSRVQVVVRPGDEAGAYVFARLHGEEPLAAGEVVLNGRVSGWQAIYYGIETWFVPEGTGAATERTARYAYVRVSAGGDAILERLDSN